MHNALVLLSTNDGEPYNLEEAAQYFKKAVTFPLSTYAYNTVL